MTSGVLPIDALIAEMARFDAIIDTRTPLEFSLDHLPGAVNFPVLSDAERVEVGTLYKQSSPFVARKRGAVLVARNIAHHIETSFASLPRSWRPLVYCWRGGQRSAAMAHVLGEVGWTTWQLERGYKGFRGLVVSGLASLPQKQAFVVLCGPTGSGKSALLRALASRSQVLDLEALALHRGSLLGAIDDVAQPSQKAFETALWQKLRGFDPGAPVFVESEGARIGRLSLPVALTRVLRQSPCILIDTPRHARIAHLLDEYPGWIRSPEALNDRLHQLTGLHSRATVVGWQALASDKRWPELVDALLLHHYDPAYNRSLGTDFGQLANAPRVGLRAFDPAGLEEAACDILALGLGRAPKTEVARATECAKALSI